MEHSTEIWSAFFKTGVVLLFVIGALLFLLYLLKRFSNLKIIKSRQAYIKVLEIHHFAPKEKVVLMEVMGKRLLIGVTAQSIQTLATIDEEVVAVTSELSTHQRAESELLSDGV